MLLAAQASDWHLHDTRLIVAAVVGIALIIVLIAAFKVHPFLALVAGPLLRRFGLRVGVAANPVVLLACALAMVVALAATGGVSLALLATVSAARVLDIALTDGTTRTSINAMYQVLPERTRLAAQATIEGMGRAAWFKDSEGNIMCIDEVR